MVRAQLRMLIVLTLVSGFLGGAVVNLLLRGTPALAQAPGPQEGLVQCKRFEVVDGSGRVRAVLGEMSNGEFGLELRDNAGKAGATLVVRSDSSGSLTLARRPADQAPGPTGPAPPNGPGDGGPVAPQAPNRPGGGGPVAPQAPDNGPGGGGPGRID
jgi:hypothetical protein